ncbi:MAG: DNA-directed RNA polymerase subunit omega [Candidatus Omnitrophica bacterium]|nr:DNA-directed RNA polymerase subunit omega [Candidatus Omnitrophota bacterium]
MGYTPIQELISKVPSVYKLVIVASRRVQELYGGSPKLTESHSRKLFEVALDEIRAGKVACKDLNSK